MRSFSPIGQNRPARPVGPIMTGMEIRRPKSSRLRSRSAARLSGRGRSVMPSNACSFAAKCACPAPRHLQSRRWVAGDALSPSSQIRDPVGLPAPRSGLIAGFLGYHVGLAPSPQSQPWISASSKGKSNRLTRSPADDRDPPLITLRRKVLRPTGAQLAELNGTPTGFIIDALGERGAVAPDIKPVITDQASFCGVAVTCHVGPADDLASLQPFPCFRPAT